MPKLAKLSLLTNLLSLPGKGPTTYACKFDWPENCPCQTGGSGLVLPSGALEQALTDATKAAQAINTVLTPESCPSEARITAFFEAFPRQPDTFLRGEGLTIEEAEANCWEKYQKIVSCPGHEFERRDRTDGYCFCKHCNLSGMFMEPTTHCCVCNIPAAHGTDRHGKMYCAEHYAEIKQEDKDELHLLIDRMHGHTG